MKTIAAYLAIAAAAAATACAATETPAIEQETNNSVATLVPASTSMPPQMTAPAEPPSTEPSTATESETVPMPDVVCMNLQDAQDRIQAAGVFFSRSEDATGAGRRQVMDRNWVVVAQTPAAGVPIGEADAVLSVVKIGEPGDCS
ncbi:PASTA domain-containing protein [Nocardia carnea]|uniref:PASTA domain-containing protein n=1 Tax=Nocardia carnea TaxID=37328 RepID=A0ABW7TVD5_9NOCA|nr:hypothetical protein [Nocardia carnea]